MDQYHVLFAHRYDQLLVEELRLKALLRDVTWYHFETVVRDWAQIDSWSCNVQRAWRTAMSIETWTTQRPEM